MRDTKPGQEEIFFLLLRDRLILEATGLSNHMSIIRFQTGLSYYVRHYRKKIGASTTCDADATVAAKVS